MTERTTELLIKLSTDLPAESPTPLSAERLTELSRARALAADRNAKAHWAGWVDLLGNAMELGAPRIQRIHWEIADSVFTQVDRLPANRPVTYVTRTLHHGIAGLVYGAVRYSGRGLSALARLHFQSK